MFAFNFVHINSTQKSKNLDNLAVTGPKICFNNICIDTHGGQHLANRSQEKVNFKVEKKLLLN